MYATRTLAMAAGNPVIHLRSLPHRPCLLFWLVCAALAGQFGIAIRASAATLYVDLNSTNAILPYDDWTNAAVTIQDAVDAASAGDTILVTNGVYATGGRTVNGYALTNRVAVTKPLTLQSVNGPSVTVIQGNGLVGTSAVRCVYLTNDGILVGFTLTNGASLRAGDALGERSGGGVWCASVSALLTNCVLVGNSVSYSGGGAYSGTLNDCQVYSNSASILGGGTYSSTL